MRNRARSTLLALAAAGLTLFCLGETANATTLNVSPAGSIRMTAPYGDFFMDGEGGLIDVITNCPLNLSGTIDSSIAVAPGAHVGEITSGSFSICDTGQFTPLFDAPRTWELTLDGFDATSRRLYVTVNDFTFSHSWAGTCDFHGDLALVVGLSGTGPYTTGTATIVNTTPIPKVTLPGYACPDEFWPDGLVNLTTQTLTVS